MMQLVSFLIEAIRSWDEHTQFAALVLAMAMLTILCCLFGRGALILFHGWPPPKGRAGHLLKTNVEQRQAIVVLQNALADTLKLSRQLAQEREETWGPQLPVAGLLTGQANPPQPPEKKPDQRLDATNRVPSQKVPQHAQVGDTVCHRVLHGLRAGIVTEREAYTVRVRMEDGSDILGDISNFQLLKKGT